MTRDDIASTAASFETARSTAEWRRRGETTPRPWTFTPERINRVAGNIEYIHQSLHRLNEVPDPIKLSYEEMTQPGFSNPELDEYFQRPIRLEKPMGPTSGEKYVTNWEVFEGFVMRYWKSLSDRIGDPRIT